MWTYETLINLIAAAVGTVGLSVIFHMRPRHIPIAALGGTLTYFVYCAMELSGVSFFGASLVSTLVLAVFAEVCARIFKAPTPIFLLSGAIPIVPGGLLYYTVSNFLSGNYEEGKRYLLSTLGVGLGIAGGMVAVSLVVSIVGSVIKRTKEKDASKDEVD